MGRLFQVFAGRMLAEVAAVMTRLRGELADALVRGGAPESMFTFRVLPLAVREALRRAGRAGSTTVP